MTKYQKIKKIVKPVAEEVEKIGETAKKQITGQQEVGENVIEYAMTHRDGRTPEVSAEEEKRRRQEELRGLQRVKEEARRESQKRKEQEAKRLQEQVEVIQQPGEPVTPALDKPLLPSSPKREPALPGVAEKGKLEIKRGK